MKLLPKVVGEGCGAGNTIFLPSVWFIILTLTFLSAPCELTLLNSKVTVASHYLNNRRFKTFYSKDTCYKARDDCGTAQDLTGIRSSCHCFVFIGHQECSQERGMKRLVF